MAKRVDELPLYKSVLEFWDAVAAILRTSQVRRNRKLFDQIDSANDSIDSNIREGFEQATDAAFANFLNIAKGSLEEVVTRVRQAQKKGLVTEADAVRIDELAVPLGKMIGGFIKYLRASGFTDRGRHHIAPSTPKPR